MDLEREINRKIRGGAACAEDHLRAGDLRTPSPMAIHQLIRRQIIQATPESCWDFFSSPANLRRITPASLDFVVLSEVPERMHPGLMIEYRVRPLFGIPMRWLTEITHVEAPHYFVDEQRIGPYHIWHHEHRFTPLPGGRMECLDRITYVPPFGPLGELMHPFVIQPELERIFRHREQVVARDIFPGSPVPAGSSAA
jgi:ligand-binding SRPBCC domain-containing protein